MILYKGNYYTLWQWLELVESLINRSEGEDYRDAQQLSGLNLSQKF